MRLTDQPERLAEMRPEVRVAGEGAGGDGPGARSATQRARYASASEFGRALCGRREGNAGTAAVVIRARSRAGSASEARHHTGDAGRRCGLAPRRAPIAPPAARTTPAGTESRMPMLVGAGVVVLALARGGHGAAARTRATGDDNCRHPAVARRTGGRRGSRRRRPTRRNSRAARRRLRPRLRCRPPRGIPSAHRAAAPVARREPPASVTAEPTGQSYARRASASSSASMKDSASAVHVGRQLPVWKDRVTLARDRATSRLSRPKWRAHGSAAADGMRALAANLVARTWWMSSKNTYTESIQIL